MHLAGEKHIGTENLLIWRSSEVAEHLQPLSHLLHHRQGAQPTPGTALLEVG